MHPVWNTVQSFCRLSHDRGGTDKRLFFIKYPGVALSPTIVPPAPGKLRLRCILPGLALIRGRPTGIDPRDARLVRERNKGEG